MKYQELAALIGEMVDSGAMPPGSRAPSLRRLSRDRQLSVGTVLQAYRLLEDRGILEVRPQSGFFVRSRAVRALPVPAASSPPTKPSTVTVSGMMIELLTRSADPELVPLGGAIPSLELLAASRLDGFVSRSARRDGGRYNAYSSLLGHPRLRQEVARLALRWGQVISPDEIVITSGCTEALLLALKAVTRPGDTVATESPTYFGILHAIEALGLKSLELPTHASTGVDIAALQRALENGSIGACILSSSFNNPVGCTTPDERKREIVRLLARYDVPLIEDDVFGDLHFGKERPRPFMTFDRRGGVIYCGSFSKTVAPGYRIGWIVAPKRIDAIVKFKAATTMSGPTLTQAAFADFLSSASYDRHLRRIRAAFADNVQRMQTAIADAFPEGTRVTRPAGGFVLWLELPNRMDTRKLFYRALDEGICFAPGDLFSATNHYAHCLRLSAGHLWSGRLERGIWKLGELAMAPQHARDV